MKHKKVFNSVVLASAIALCGCSASGWEYKTVRAGSGLPDAELDKLGAAQWELIGYSRAVNPGKSDDVVYIFKRHKTNRDWWKFWK
jgi:hypothetical protein